MEKKERNWLFILTAIFIVFNVITLSPMIPWQSWLLWSHPTPDQTVNLVYSDYDIQMDQPIEVKAGEYIDFHAKSEDVTYGFGVFRKDMSMVFQMQVMPGQDNHILWKFDEPGWYDVRSTEYSGPKHSGMYYPDAINVKP
jgi:cytochrome c oxidase subunit II